MQKTHIGPHWPSSSVISHSSKYNAATSASFWGSGPHIQFVGREGSNSASGACVPVTRRPRVQSLLRAERLVKLRDVGSM